MYAGKQSKRSIAVDRCKVWRGRGGGGGGGEGEGIVSLLMVRQKWCLGDRSYGVIMTSGFSPCDHGQGNGPS